MNKRELRIGNFICASEDEEGNPEACQITQLKNRGLVWSSELTDNPQGENYTDYESVTPILLNEDWLKKAQFEIEKYRDFVDFRLWIGDDGFRFIWRIDGKKTQFFIQGNGGYDEAGEMDITETCKYVHQLQNIYFALLGEELPISI